MNQVAGAVPPVRPRVRPPGRRLPSRSPCASSASSSTDKRNRPPLRVLFVARKGAPLERIRREMGIGLEDEADDAMTELDDEPITLDD